MRSNTTSAWRKTVSSTMAALALASCLGVGAMGCGTEDEGASSVQRYHRDLSLGASGDDVRALNDYLTQFGYFPSDKLAGEYPNWRPLVAQGPADQAIF